jgi:hypothetical protein
MNASAGSVRLPALPARWYTTGISPNALLKEVTEHVILLDDDAKPSRCASSAE